MRRPAAYVLAASLLGWAVFASPAPAAPEGDAAPGGGEAGDLTPEVREAVRKGLAYLKRTQQPDGSWLCNVGFKINETYRVTSVNARHPGVTALAGTAFLAGGHLPGRGPYGDVVQKATDYIVSRVQPDGFITENDTRMYSHAFAALFLAEVYGTTQDPRVRQALDRAVQFILRSQNSQGGWRYEANAVDSDMSITVCQVMALRAARNKGIRVPQQAIDAAVAYVLNSAVTRGESSNFGLGEGDMRRGAFKYQYRERNPIATRSSLALTAAAMTTLFGAGLYDDPSIQEWARAHGLARYRSGAEKPPSIAEMAEYILEEYEGHRRRHGRQYFYFYGHYYASQAMYVAGGRWWDRYFPLVRDHLLRQQDGDGSWDVTSVGRTFGTSVACVILQVPMRYLPVLDQR